MSKGVPSRARGGPGIPGPRAVRALACAYALGAPGLLLAWPTIELEPAQDNTLYETAIDSGDTQNELSNGTGNFVFTGRTGLDGGFRARRALMRFDLSVLPAGAQILAAQLTLYQSRAAPGSPPAEIGLYRVLQDWGEGASKAIPPEGQGDFAAPGDATWHHRFHPDMPWNSAGGDFAAAASTSVTVSQDLDDFTWPCTAALVADVQAWLEDPGVNFGWILIGGEGGGTSAHRFNSRENSLAATRPRLTIEYQAPGTVLADGFESGIACD